MKTLLSFFLSNALIFSPFAHAQNATRGISSAAVLVTQNLRIERRLKAAYQTYLTAAQGYNAKGPQAFVETFAKASSLSSEDQKVFLSLFKGLPKLPQMQIASRGFEVSDKRVGYKIQVEIADLDRSIIKINDEVLQINERDSFEEGLAKVQVILKNSPQTATLWERGWNHVIPEAHAFLIPILAGGILYAIVNMFTKKKDEPTKKSAETPFVVELPGNTSASGGHTITPVPAPAPAPGHDNATQEQQKAEYEKRLKLKDAVEAEWCNSDGQLSHSAREKFDQLVNSNAFAADSLGRTKLNGPSNEWEAYDVWFFGDNKDKPKESKNAQIKIGGEIVCEGSLGETKEEKDKAIAQFCSGDQLNDTVKKIAKSLWEVKNSPDPNLIAAQEKSLKELYKDGFVHKKDPYHFHPYDTALAIYVEPDGKVEVSYGDKNHCVGQMEMSQ